MDRTGLFLFLLIYHAKSPKIQGIGKIFFERGKILWKIGETAGVRTDKMRKTTQEIEDIDKNSLHENAKTVIIRQDLVNVIKFTSKFL